jgi:hypothetical protein
MKLLGAFILGVTSASLGCGGTQSYLASDGSAGGTSNGASGGQGDVPVGQGGSSGGQGGATGGQGAVAGSSTASTGGMAGATATGTLPALPEGNTGIAAKHPGDVGIAGDTAVIFADDFESYAQAADIAKRWDNMYQNQDIAIATTAANVYAGKQALEFTLPQETAELSDAVEKIVSPELDVLFLRYYSKFQPPYDVVGSSHNGSSISAHYEVGYTSTPGVPANGTNKFLANLENWRGDATTVSPGDLNIYIYHPLQRTRMATTSFPRAWSCPIPAFPSTSVPISSVGPISFRRSTSGMATRSWSRRTRPAKPTAVLPPGSTASWSWTSPTCACVTWPA